MASKDLTSFFGSIRFVLPLILIFFIAAGSANACPNHRSSAAYRTNSYSTRKVSYMAPVVITYGGRCADTRYGTRRVKYVSMRDNGYYEGGTRYVAVRRSVPRTRYVAVRDDDDYYVPTRRVRYVVRDDDYDYAPRYIAVRRAPVYVDSGARLVAIRNYAPRTRVVAHIDEGYSTPTYVTVQRVPVVDDFFAPRTTRVVAVRNTGCGCSRAVSYRNDFDDDDDIVTARRVVYRDEVPYTSGVRHIVVKTDDIDGTEQVIYSGSNYDDSAYVDLPDESVQVTRQVSYNDMDDVDFDHQTVSYDDAAYVADDDMDAACLPESAVYTSPGVVTRRHVSYVPADEVNDHDVIGGSNVAFVTDDDAAPPERYVSVVADSEFDDSDVAYISDDDVDCPDDVSVRAYDNDTRVRSINFVPVERVNYAPVEQVVYAPADKDMDCSCETSMNTFSDQPVDDVDAVADNVYYSDAGEPILTSNDRDEQIAVAEVDNEMDYVPYEGDHSAETQSDVYFAYTE
jgi:hypothetical protein